MPAAFVLNIAMSGLSAMRNLGRQGIPVVGVDSNPDHIGFASRYGRAIVAPNPEKEPERLVDSLLEQASTYGQPSVLSPASDGTVLFVSRYRDALAAQFRFTLPPDNVLEAVINKRRLYDLADQNGLHTADTFYPASIEDVGGLADQVKYPLFIKPYYSHRWQEHFPGGKGFKVFNGDQLLQHFERIYAVGEEAMMQSIIAGPASNIRTVYMYVNNNGHFTGVLTTRKLRQFPVEFGRGSLAETYRDDDVAQVAVQFFRDIGYRGFGTLEFKHDEHDGCWKVTDLNPRWVGPQSLPTEAGIDFPLMHYRDLAGIHQDPILTYREGIRWLNGVNDLASSWWHFRHGDLQLAEWLKSYTSVRAHAAFAMDDPGPFLKEYEYGKKLFRIPLNLLKQRG